MLGVKDEARMEKMARKISATSGCCEAWCEGRSADEEADGCDPQEGAVQAAGTQQPLWVQNHLAQFFKQAPNHFDSQWPEPPWSSRLSISSRHSIATKGAQDRKIGK